MLTRLLPAFFSAASAAVAAWPSQCLICRAWPAQALCADCTARHTRPVPRCTRCALPVPPGVAVCGACLRQPPPMALCLAALPYAWPWTACLSRWKFQAEPGLSRPLAQLMQAAPGMRQALAEAAHVLPMPMSTQRLGERGYNPALLLARQLAPAHTRTDWLRRTRDTAPQRLLTRAQRLRNVRGAFELAPGCAAMLAGQHVALIDDIMTTGASVREAAGALQRAGAGPISVLVLARTSELPG